MPRGVEDDVERERCAGLCLLRVEHQERVLLRLGVPPLLLEPVPERVELAPGELRLLGLLRLM
jgi:hypothetical protein